MKKSLKVQLLAELFQAPPPYEVEFYIGKFFGLTDPKKVLNIPRSCSYEPMFIDHLRVDITTVFVKFRLLNEGSIVVS